MNTKLPRLLFAALCALAFAFTTVSAQESDAKKARGPSKADMKKYDANQDGALDEAETAKMMADRQAKKEADHKARLERYDTNKDGKLSKEEREAEKADREAEKAAKAAKKVQDDAKKTDRAKEKSKK